MAEAMDPAALTGCTKPFRISTLALRRFPVANSRGSVVGNICRACWFSPRSGAMRKTCRRRWHRAAKVLHIDGPARRQAHLMPRIDVEPLVRSDEISQNPHPQHPLSSPQNRPLSPRKRGGEMAWFRGLWRHRDRQKTRAGGGHNPRPSQ